MQEAVGVLLALVTSVFTTCLLVMSSRWLGANEGKTDEGSNWRSVPARFFLSVAMSFAFFVGMSWLLGEVALSDPSKTKFWHWLAPVSVVAAFITSPLTMAKSAWRYAAWLTIGLAVAYLLVPTWESLVPPRNVYIPVFGVFVAGLIASYEFVSGITSPREQVVMLFATSVGVAVSCAAVVSLKFGLLAAYVALGFAGALVASFFVALDPLSIRGSMPTAAVLVASTAFFGFVYPENPIPELALLPWAPCMAIPWNRNWKTRLCAVIAIVVGLVLVLWMRFEVLA